MSDENSVAIEAKTIKEKVEDAFEDFREYLVYLLGDIHGVHTTVDDAKASIAAHVPASPDDTAQVEGTNNVAEPAGEKGEDGNSNPEAGAETKPTT